MHLDALAELLDQGLIMFSLGPIIRSIVEHCARAAWALDPRCTLRQRLARAFWVRHDDLRQASRLAKASGSAKDLKTYRDMQKELRQSWLSAMFWPSERKYAPGNHDLLAVCNERLPGFSELVSYLSGVHPTSTWNARSAYDFLSAHTHPTMHVYRMRTSEDDTIQSEAASDLAPVIDVRLSMKDTSEPRDLTFLATYCVTDMWRLMISYYGLDSHDEPVAGLLKKVWSLRQR